MILLNRYIIKTVLASIALVTLMLAGLYVFILFVGQLGDLGKADYNLKQAAFFVLLQVPYQIYLFFPMASLLGSLIGLGVMANHRELVVMRAAGMSIGQITWAVVIAATVVVLITTIAGETFIPKLTHLANDKKMQAITGGQTLRVNQGLWLRYQNDFIFIGSISKHHKIEQVHQFHFDNQHHLRFIRKIEQLKYVNNHWQAFNINETQIRKETTDVKTLDQLNWDVPINPAIFDVNGNEPNEMTIYQLHQYLSAQEHSYQSVINYQLVYWQRLVRPLTTMVMMILAIPFIFGPLRSSTMGSKLLIGATIGFGFHIMNQFCGPISQVFQWPAELAAMGPTCLFAILGLYLMKRTK